MSRRSISFTEPNSGWRNGKVNVEHEYRSNSKAVNDLIRKAREVEAIRIRLIQAEQGGFTEMTREEIRAEVREELRRNGELPDQQRSEGRSAADLPTRRPRVRRDAGRSMFQISLTRSGRCAC